MSRHFFRLAAACALVSFAPAWSADSLGGGAAPSGATPVEHRINVAVLPFTGNAEIQASDLTAMTGRFESELVRTDAFRVLERRDVDAILREQGLQQSGACTTGECQVQVGQLLGVERIITGDVTRLGKLWSLNLRMVDVGSGAVLASHVLDIKGKLETVLRGGCPEIAYIISGRKKPAASRTILTEEKNNAWAWVAGGAIVAGGAVAAVLLLRGGDSAAPRDVTISFDTGK